MICSLCEVDLSISHGSRDDCNLNLDLLKLREETAGTPMQTQIKTMSPAGVLQDAVGRTFCYLFHDIGYLRQ